jgi:UDP-N-acetylglucosamine diphosphorylase / glucose-1-phosphate thymidylyltransferase / UDP-N-acetylgalactosamine diphosphorylase / glucosamine-1-phosphate N-acetyltransferase / galactosamine-1-phosphate N-acetyltransferase
MVVVKPLLQEREESPGPSFLLLAANLSKPSNLNESYLILYVIFNLELVFLLSKHYLDSLLIDNDEASVSSLKVLNQPLIVRNLGMVNGVLNIHRIRAPSECRTVLRLIQDNFPEISVDEYNADNTNNTNNDDDDDDDDIPTDTSTSARSFKKSVKGNMNRLEMPLNSALWYSQLEKDNILVTPIVYPWDFHYIVQRILREEVTEASVSPNVSIAKSTIIDGPCMIEDGVTIDDFCKIKGPTYIGKGSFVGMSSLIRNCMIGDETRIGFNCEVGRSYFTGHDKIPHQNVIVDSLIGENVWFGAYSVTLNVLFSKNKIPFETDKGKAIDTGMDHFGAVIGNNSTIGTSVTIFPGRQIHPGTVVSPDTIVTRTLVGRASD